jgi:hypothetical protein
MNGLATTLLLLTGVALLTVPRRYAVSALLAGTCYLPAYVSVELGSFHFTPIRVLITVAVVRMLLRGEAPLGALNGMDRTMLVWGAWLLLSSVFHDEPVAALVLRLGLAYDAIGVYALLRTYCRSIEDVTCVLRVTAVTLVPLALALLYEKTTTYNVFSSMGGVGERSLVRAGNVRANGPFAHPILAGTVGGVCLPLMIGLWKAHPTLAKLGLLACISIVLSSGSSGPILSATAGVFGIYLWRHRNQMRTVRWLALLTYVTLDIVMKDPAYFIIARVDLAGGSTSWYRARLIQSAFEHLSEWWLAGTDYTREWMGNAVAWSGRHTDITSYYIELGVWGGLPLMLLFVLMLGKGFVAAGDVVQRTSTLQPTAAFQVWACGAMLLSLAITGLSVSYFDQSVVFVYLVLGVISSASSSMTAHDVEKVSAEPAPTLCEAPYRRFI